MTWRKRVSDQDEGGFLSTTVWPGLSSWGLAGDSGFVGGFIIVFFGFGVGTGFGA